MNATFRLRPGCRLFVVALGLTIGLAGGLSAQSDTKSPSDQGGPVTTNFHPVDLTQHYYKKLNTYRAGEIWSLPPRGWQTFGGVPFVVEGRIEFTGMYMAADKKFYQTRALGIPIGLRGRAPQFYIRPKF